MQLLLIMCVVILVIAKMDKKLKCHEGVHVSGKFHRKEVLTNGINRPYQLSFYEHRVYFSYNVGGDKEDNFEIGYVTETVRIPIPFNVTKNGFATAVDFKDKVIYFGGSDGIYAHDIKSDKTNHVIKGHNIWDLFFKHELYFIEFPSQRLHTYNRKTENTTFYGDIKEKIYQFVIDGDNDTFITTSEGLFEIKNGTNDRISYEGPKHFRCMVVNDKGVVHFCGTNAIYVANKTNHTLHEIALVKHIFGLTFDNHENIIYSNPHEIVKLVPAECE